MTTRRASKLSSASCSRVPIGRALVVATLALLTNVGSTAQVICSGRLEFVFHRAAQPLGNQLSVLAHLFARQRDRQMLSVE